MRVPSTVRLRMIHEITTSTVHESGGIGMELMEMLEADRVGMGKWVSCGNSSSVGVAEILAHMGQDPRIEVIAIYLEGLSEGLKLMEIGRQVAAEKPVIIIKGGSGGGKEATMSHTASLAGDQAEELRAQIKDSLFKARETLEETKESLKDRSQAAVVATEDYVQANPWQSVGIAAGVGFVLGLLATRR